VSIPDLKPRQTVKRKEEKKVAVGTKKQPAGPVYTIQAASVKNVKDADRLVAKLKKKGYPAYRAAGNVPGRGVWFRVRIGEYNSKVQARRTIDKLKKLGLKPILLEK
jgi:cell division septation protein DedD